MLGLLTMAVAATVWGASVVTSVQLAGWLLAGREPEAIARQPLD